MDVVSEKLAQIVIRSVSVMQNRFPQAEIIRQAKLIDDWLDFSGIYVG